MTILQIILMTVLAVGFSATTAYSITAGRRIRDMRKRLALRDELLRLTEERTERLESLAERLVADIEDILKRINDMNGGGVPND